jgi:Tol biopolymer transport system component
MAAETNLSPDLIGAQLERVLASKLFRTSELQKQFLTYVVRLTLEGKTAEIKEYAIGAEAFRRGAEFDPRIDSVVRVIARRVRDRLSEFYSQEGKNDSLLIQLSPGSYVPSFSVREQSPAAAPASEPPPPAVSLRSRWVWLSVVAVAAVLVAAYLILQPGPPPKIAAFHQLTHDGQAKLGAFALGVPAPLVSDGSRLYFEEVIGSEVVDAEVSTSGGETVPLHTGFKRPLVLIDLSPDRSRLLLKNFFEESLDGALFKMSIPGGMPRRVGNLTAHDAAWSPDGAHICYVTADRLYFAGPNGTDSKTIASFAGEPSWPRWSPDGARIRLTVQDDKGRTSLWEVSAAGGKPYPLLSNWSDHSSACCGSWSPNGKYFVFQATQQGITSLWAIREKHKLFGRFRNRPVRLTQGPLDVSAPLFSSDGRRIFAVVRQRRGELVRYDASQHDFRLYLGGMSADHVEFSRDSQWIAYSTYPEEEIWRSRPDGSERLQLSSAPLAAIFPRWSPDGRQIAFMGTKPGGPVKIYIVPANGGDPEPLLPGSVPETDPNWSPDGDEIMFATLPSVNGVAKGRPAIQTIDLKSRKITTLPGSEGLQAPRWSPDGRFVVATALSEGKWANPAVVIYDFTTGKWTGFEKDPIDNKWWSADGKYFYFDKLIDNDPAIYRLRMSDRSIERVTGLKDVRRSFGDMGWWMGITPDGSPMVLRDTSIAEIYSLDLAP